MYIYINSTLVSTIHITYKKKYLKKYLWRTKPYKDVCVTRYVY